MKTHDPSTVRLIEERYRDIYAHAVETSLGSARQLHISGQLGIDREGRLQQGFAEQCRCALRNVEAILEAAGMSKRDIVKATYLVVRSEDLPDLSAVRRELWGGVRPAVTTYLVAGLVHPDFLIEVEVLAQQEAPSLPNA
jgi:enamine deaminase RidA (YjgF/YER057c/UK114 family)